MDIYLLLVKSIALIVLVYIAIKLIFTGISLLKANSEQVKKIQLAHGATYSARLKTWWSGIGLKPDMSYQCVSGVETVGKNRHVNIGKPTRSHVLSTLR